MKKALSAIHNEEAIEFVTEEDTQYILQMIDRFTCSFCKKALSKKGCLYIGFNNEEGKGRPCLKSEKCCSDKLKIIITMAICRPQKNKGIDQELVERAKKDIRCHPRKIEKKPLSH